MSHGGGVIYSDKKLAPHIIRITCIYTYTLDLYVTAHFLPQGGTAAATPPLCRYAIKL